jgi:hypothetical protein
MVTKSAGRLFQLVHALETTGFIANDAVACEMAHKSIAEFLESFSKEPTDADARFRDFMGMKGWNEHKPGDYLRMRKTFDDAVVELRHGYGVWPLHTPERLLYSVDRMLKRSDADNRVTAPRALIERLEMGDLALPEGLASVLNMGYNAGIDGTYKPFNLNGQHEKERRLLNELSIVDNSGPHPKAVRDDSYALTYQTVFRHAAEYRGFLQNLHTIALKQVNSPSHQ